MGRCCPAVPCSGTSSGAYSHVMTDAQQSSTEAFADLLCGLSKLSLPPQPLPQPLPPLPPICHHLRCHLQYGRLPHHRLGSSGDPRLRKRLTVSERAVRGNYGCVAYECAEGERGTRDAIRSISKLHAKAARCLRAHHGSMAFLFRYFPSPGLRGQGPSSLWYTSAVRLARNVTG